MTKLSDLKAGDKVRLDSGFTCIGPCEAVLHSDEKGNGLYFMCSGGEDTHDQGTDAQVDAALLTERHFLDGQLNDDGTLSGVELVQPQKRSDPHA